MNTNHRQDKNPDRARAQLDALLNRGVQADKRATKPAIPIAPTTVQPAAMPATPPVPAPLPSLQRMTVRFTQAEARLLEKVRAAARAMGYKISDTAVFRLALNVLDADRITTQQIETILQADSRRKQEQSTR